MPTRSVYNHSLINQPIHPANNSNQMPPIVAPAAATAPPTTALAATSTHVDLTSYIGKVLTINQHQVVVEDILGQGGFAFVFLVRSLNQQQQRFALKRMYVNNEQDLQVCQREIAILKEFASNVNIVKYIDSSIQRLSPPVGQKRHVHLEKNVEDLDDDEDHEEDAIYEILLLTEYCSHGALTTRLNEQRTNGVSLNERQILRIFADICSAVSTCHHRRPQPILHRDIKLENILIDSHQSFVLCDFGSAIFLPPSPNYEHQQYQPNQLTTATIQQLEEEIQRYTTLAYRPPEMIDLYSRLPITLKADIWAMGCLLYKLMYNLMPFGDSILAIQNGTFTLPDETAQLYSRELNVFLRYMLEIDISKRPDIWQVSHVTYKLLGMECPVPNRYQSKVPDLTNITMPLTDSESRHQRAMALAAAKSSASNQLDETSTVGTAVNPRERPRGMMAPSGSLLNFNSTTSRAIPMVAPPPLNAPVPPAPPAVVAPLPLPTQIRSSHQRSGSAAQLMFDDDFSQFPTHALSLNNIPNTAGTTPKAATNAAAAPITAAATSERNMSRARPSPPSSISAASGLAIQKQLFPPPPAPSFSSSTTSQPQVPTTSQSQHRRSASQTMSPPTYPSSQQQQQQQSQISSSESGSAFDRRHSIDSAVKEQQQVLFIGEASDDDDDADADALGTNLNKLKVHNHSTENVKSRESLILNEDDRLFTKTYMIKSQLKSDDEQTSSSSSSDEQEKTVRQKSKKKSQMPITPLRAGHHPSTDDGDKGLSSPNTHNKNLVKRLIERCSLQQSDEPSASSTPYKRKDSFTLASEHPIAMGGGGGQSDKRKDSDEDDDDDDENGDEKRDDATVNNVTRGFDQLINEDSDDEHQAIQAMNTNKPMMSSGLFLPSRVKEHQYEHFQDSDDDDDDTENIKQSTAKTSSNPTTKLFNLFTSNSKTNSSDDTKRILNEQLNQTNSSFIDHDNPFLHAPFHHSHRSPTQKPIPSAPFSSSSSSSTNVDMTTSSFDPTSIVVGKRLSAFAPYQRQDVNAGTNAVDSNASGYNFGLTKQKLPHSESYPPGINTNTASASSTISKDVFINAPFKTKVASKPTRTMASNKVSTISPSSSQSTSSSNSQLIDLSVPPQPAMEVAPTTKEPVRRAVGSAGLAAHFGTLGTVNSSNETYFFHSDRSNADGRSSSEELTSSRKRHSKKKSSATTGPDSQEQHAYANLSFNDAIVDEFL